MKKPFAPTLAALLATALLPSTAHAHYIWATVEGGQVRFALLESLSESPSAQFAPYVADLTPQSGGVPLTLGPAKDGARYAPLASGQNVVLAESVVGARERGGPPYLLIYDAKGADTLAHSSTVVGAPAEVLARRDGDTLVVTVYDNGKPALQSDVTVEWPGTKADADPKSIATDSHGEARIPYPTAAPTGGFVGVRALVTEAKAGDADGKHYATIHRWATLTFPTTTATTDAAKPFHTLLRAAFGDNHEVVSHTAFNETLFADKLTKAQLLVHLQQRALIHDETNRILLAALAANPAPFVPYGPAQRDVLALLRADLVRLGSRWPTDTDARPLTRAFLDEIRSSEKQGPYFALGVQHVYYGGITNGGRMIGQQIAETLKIAAPTYYEKSDGYPDYLAQVDKIADPAARAEMIRGGKAAYRYIITSSNEDIFKPGGN